MWAQTGIDRTWIGLEIPPMGHNQVLMPLVMTKDTLWEANHSEPDTWIQTYSEIKF